MGTQGGEKKIDEIRRKIKLIQAEVKQEADKIDELNRLIDSANQQMVDAVFDGSLAGITKAGAALDRAYASLKAAKARMLKLLDEQAAEHREMAKWVAALVKAIAAGKAAAARK